MEKIERLDSLPSRGCIVVILIGILLLEGVTVFTIGTFSKIAQVSLTLLRFYDGIDLFKPARIDPDSGYRY